MTVSIEISMKDYSKTEYRTGYRGLYAYIKFANGSEKEVSDISNTNVIAFVEKALDEVIKSTIASGYGAQDITLQGVTVTEGAKTFLSEKYTSDPLIDSINFTE